ncbi:MAG: hydrogenase formation protein HypD [Anaerovoracaceae bacterium]
MDINKIIKKLKEYDGRQLKIMEVCGTHTSSIFKHGIRNLISKKIELISGPGCPVCVTASSYIDRCIELSKDDNTILYSFGDMLKVPGGESSLSNEVGNGAKVKLVYSPFQLIDEAKKRKGLVHIMAAVGFETTAASYALLVDEIVKNNIENIKLLTALKTVPPALEWICENKKNIDAFIAPGHVSVIIGEEPFCTLSQKYKKPFVISGFEAEEILIAIYEIVMELEKRDGLNDKNLYEKKSSIFVKNVYTSAVKKGGNLKAQALIKKYFISDETYWRGLGKMKNSGLFLREKYFNLDSESKRANYDSPLKKGCRCGDVITGTISPEKCELFSKVCNPNNAIGPCMVSSEGACGIYYQNI